MSKKSSTEGCCFFCNVEYLRANGWGIEPLALSIERISRFAAVVV